MLARDVTVGAERCRRPEAAGRGQKANCFLRVSGRNQPCRHLDFSPVNLTLDLDPTEASDKFVVTGYSSGGKVNPPPRLSPFTFVLQQCLQGRSQCHYITAFCYHSEIAKAVDMVKRKGLGRCCSSLG